MNQLEFDFIGIQDQPSKARLINESVIDFDEKFEWHRTCKLGDWILDKTPYGWRAYYKVQDIKRWFVTIYQRLRYGVADSECWSLDYTLSLYILPRLKHFKKMTRYTYPSNITPERWEEILDEMIWAFEYMLNEDKFIKFPMSSIDFNDPSSFNREKTPEQKQDWIRYLDESNALQYRKNQALLLFAKYYESLWD